MKRDYERRFETAAEVVARCAEQERRGEQVWLGSRFVLFEVTPASIAKRRLQEVIAADRSAVPCGRWVRKYWRLIAPGVMGLEGTLPPEFDKRPRYRYEVRR